MVRCGGAKTGLLILPDSLLSPQYANRIGFRNENRVLPTANLVNGFYAQNKESRSETTERLIKLTN
jgi:hypothetical protein